MPVICHGMPVGKMKNETQCLPAKVHLSRRRKRHKNRQFPYKVWGQGQNATGTRGGRWASVGLGEAVLKEMIPEIGLQAWVSFKKKEEENKESKKSVPVKENSPGKDKETWDRLLCALDYRKESMGGEKPEEEARWQGSVHSLQVFHGRLRRWNFILRQGKPMMGF